MSVAPKKEPKWLPQLFDFIKEKDGGDAFAKKCDTVYNRAKRNWESFKSSWDEQRDSESKKAKKPKKASDPSKGVAKAAVDYEKSVIDMSEEDVEKMDNEMAAGLLELPSHILEKVLAQAVETNLIQSTSSNDPAKGVTKITDDYEKSVLDMDDEQVEQMDEEMTEKLLELPTHILEKVLAKAVETKIINVPHDDGLENNKRRLNEEENEAFLSRALELYTNFENKIIKVDVDEKEELHETVRNLYGIVQELTE